MPTVSESNPYQAPSGEDAPCGEDAPWRPSLFRKAVGLLAAVLIGVTTFYGIPFVIYFAFGATPAGLSIFVAIIPAFYLANLAHRFIVTGKLRK